MTSSGPADPKSSLAKGAALRTQKRFPFDWEAALQCPDWQMAEKLATSNISKGGMFLKTSNPVPVGTRVKVTLNLPDRRLVDLWGTVRHVVWNDSDLPAHKPAGIGVEIDEELKNELMALVEIAQLRQGKEINPPEPQDDAEAPPKKPISPQGKVAEIAGFDFGLSFSKIAMAIGDSICTIPDEKGRLQIPSVVFSLDEGNPLVGWSARRQQIAHPQRAITYLKRILGKPFSDARIAAYLQTLYYPTSAGPNDSILIECGKQVFPVPQICSWIFKELMEMGERFTHAPVKRAVLAYPMFFSENQKTSLTRAAEIAGLEVAELIEEPAAALLSSYYGTNISGKIAVYDFGGGTFEFTVLELLGNQYQVLITQGDDWLGGDDFDRTLAEALANFIWKRTKVDIRENITDWQKLMMVSSQSKCTLSEAEAVEIDLQKILPNIPGAENLKHTIEREALERVLFPLFDCTTEICEQALRIIGMHPRDLDQVVLCGGTAKIPFIRSALERFFERKLPEPIDAKESIALGAGIFSATLCKQPVKKIHTF